MTNHDQTVTDLRGQVETMAAHLRRAGLIPHEDNQNTLTAAEQASISAEIASHEAEWRAEVDAIQSKQAEVQARWDAARAMLNVATEEMTTLRNELLRGNDIHHARRAELAQKLGGRS